MAWSPPLFQETPLRKVVLGFLFMALATVLLGGASLAMLRSTLRRQDRLVTEYLDEVVVTQELVTASHQSSRKARDFLFTGEERLLTERAAAHAHFEAALHQLTSGQVFPEERRLLKRVQLAFEHYWLGGERAIAAWRGGERTPELGRRIEAELLPARQALEEALDELADYERMRYLDSQRETQGAASQALWLLTAGFLGTAVASALLGAFLVRVLRQRARTEQERQALLERERTAHHTVEERQALLDLVIEQSGDAIVVTDAQGVIRLFNAEAERQHGVTRKQVAAPEWAATFGLLTLDGHPLPLEETPLYRALRGGEPVTDARWLVRRPDGSVRTLCGTASPLRRGDGSPVGAVLTARDETERLALEQQRAESLEQLRSTAEFRERFLGIVGHDLRNPLNAITLSSHMLLVSETLPERERKVVRRIAASGDRMARMISELLDFTRSRLGGGMPVDPRPSDLSTICREVVEELEASHPSSRLSLKVLGHGHGEWDAGRLSQAVSNLVGNALQYSPEGAPIRVTVDGHAANEVVLSVHNQGEPIPTELMPELFEPFRRGAREKGPAHSEGLGLGLYIVQQIVLAHGGSVDAASHAQTGTTFTARLPRVNRLRAPRATG